MAKPYLIVTSEKVSKEYLDYLDRQNISWIACVKEHVDLVRATEILAEQFGVERMSIVGGPKINTAFLEAGLLDEISLLSGAGIDGRCVAVAMYLLFFLRNYLLFLSKLVDCLEKCLIYGHIRRFAN